VRGVLQPQQNLAESNQPPVVLAGDCKREQARRRRHTTPHPTNKKSCYAEIKLYGDGTTSTCKAQLAMAAWLESSPLEDEGRGYVE
jgi:hypothetical protein